MKFAALVSGGKDSIYNIMECIKNGHELVACVHLGAPSCQEEESYMYQTAASEVLPIQIEECLGVPLVLYERKGTSSNTSLVYEATNEADEVEDLYKALLLTQEQYPEIQAVASGAILSTYQRVRIENVCSRLKLTSLSYLWRRDSQHAVLKSMLDDGVVACLVKTACPPGLLPGAHLQKTLNELYDSGLLQKLHDRYQFHMCGEGGEYESLVLDCPLFHKRLVLDETQIIEAEDDGVGVLMIQKCHAQAKTNGATGIRLKDESTIQASPEQPLTMVPPSNKAHSVETSPRLKYLPHVRRIKGGLLHVSEIMSSVAAQPHGPSKSEADLAVEEAMQVLDLLQLTLACHGATTQDVIFVHLYLSEISHFASINHHYREVFGILLPPSRSCVAVGTGVLPGGRRVSLDCMAQCGSGQYMRGIRASDVENPYAKAARLATTSSLRQVLHVQSISYWAPVCVGPYSQANTLRSSLHFVAGQIGLIPETMKLRDTWTDQLNQCWTNVANVLDAIDGGSLTSMLSCLVYISGKVISQNENVWETAKSVCLRSVLSNGDVVPGAIDSTASQATIYGGYEDEETWRAIAKSVASRDLSTPILLVVIPEMPVGALTEVEVVCASQRALYCLETNACAYSLPASASEVETTTPVTSWETGYDFTLPKPSCTLNDSMCINVSIRTIGHGCAAMAVVWARTKEKSACTKSISPVDIGHLLNSMVGAPFQNDSLEMTRDDIVHVRLFHVGDDISQNLECTRRRAIDDGINVRSSLHAVLASCQAVACGNKEANKPSCSVVPVQAMKVLPISSSATIEGMTVFAMQIFLTDPVHMENEIWIRHGRDTD